MRKLMYNISENFNVFRWSLSVIAVCFVAVVGVYKYIDLSDNASITFSSLETTYLLLDDFINISFIYLPLYLFLICGIGLSSSFGNVEILKYNSRSHWYLNKFLTLLFYTCMFFSCLLLINFLICSDVFVYTENWSTDFVRMQVSMGQNAQNFIIDPVFNIGMLLGSMFFMYLLSGTVSLVVSVATGKESVSLVAAIVVGMIVSIIFSSVVFVQNDILSSWFEILIFVVLVSIFYLVGRMIALRRDFSEDNGGKFEL